MEIKVVTLIEFRGHSKQCMALQGSWSDSNVIALFRNSGWELPTENITGVWNITRSLIEDEFPHERQVLLHITKEDMRTGSLLPDSPKVINFLHNICKAKLIV